jgi:hypothetical protein
MTKAEVTIELARPRSCEKKEKGSDSPSCTPAFSSEMACTMSPFATLPGYALLNTLNLNLPQRIVRIDALLFTHPLITDLQNSDLPSRPCSFDVSSPPYYESRGHIRQCHRSTPSKMLLEYLPESPGRQTMENIPRSTSPSENRIYAPSSRNHNGSRPAIGSQHVHSSSDQFHEVTNHKMLCRRIKSASATMVKTPPISPENFGPSGAPPSVPCKRSRFSKVSSEHQQFPRFRARRYKKKTVAFRYVQASKLYDRSLCLWRVHIIR